MLELTWRRLTSLAVVAAISAVLLTKHSDGAPIGISGEIVETFCWGKLKVGGAAHTSCGIECAKRGIPVAVVDKKSGKVFVLLPGRSKMSVPPELVAMMGRQVTIQGEVIMRGGSNFLLVDSWMPARTSS
jgi:hypothetical protein